MLQISVDKTRLLKKLWVFFKLVMMLLTVLTILILFVGALPTIMEWKVIQNHSELPFIFTIVVFFWCIYLTKWVKAK